MLQLADLSVFLLELVAKGARGLAQLGFESHELSLEVVTILLRLLQLSVKSLDLILSILELLKCLIEFVLQIRRLHPALLN